MTREFWHTVAWSLCGWWLLLPGAAVRLQAEEPAAEFVEQLRARGYFDMADLYLLRMQTSPLAPPPWQELIPYERAVTAVKQAELQADPAQRATRMGEAKSLFESFLNKQPQHARAEEARDWLRKILLDQARAAAARGQRGAGDPQSQQLLAQSRARFEEASQSYEQHIADLRKELVALMGQPATSQPDRRQALRLDYLQSKLISAMIAYEVAETLRGDATGYEKQLRLAADRFQELSEKYRKRLHGLHAILMQGRCYEDLGEYSQALSFYQELLDPHEQPEPVRRLSAQAAAHTVDCHASEALGQYDQAIRVGQDWLASAAPVNADLTEVQDLYLALARALGRKAEQPSTKDSKRLVMEAQKYVLPIARVAGPRQKEARTLLANWNTGRAAPAEPEVQEFESFDDAKLAGDDARGELQSAEMVIRLVEPKLKSTRDATRRKELEQELTEAQADAAVSRRRALACYRQALEMMPGDAPLDEVNRLRYHRCYLSFGQQRYEEAAVIGAFLARRFPESAEARYCANIALASYLKLYSAAKKDDPAFEIRQLVEVADFIAATWPQQVEAQDALLTLVSFMISQGKLDKALEYLSKIPDNSTRRGEAELRTGQAMWSEYVRARRSTARGESPPHPNWKQRREQAQKTLTDGVERLAKAPPTTATAAAALSLAQIHVDNSQPQQALRWLRDDRIGPLTLVEKQHPLTQVPGLATATYKTTLQAQLAAMAQSPADQKLTDETNRTMDQLRATLSDTPQGRQRLVATYVSLASDLQRQLAETPAADRQNLAGAFESFLDQVSTSTTELNVLHWVAEAFVELGQLFTDDEIRVTPQARKYYLKASQVFGQMLDQATDRDQEVDPNLRTQIRMRRASTLRRLGSYGQALDEFEKILVQRNALLNIQIEAALALEAGGQAGKPSLFSEAIKGARRNNNTGKNTIWGWERIARVAQAQMQKSDELRARFRDSFFQAQYHLARCRYQQALQSSGESKTKYFQSAKRRIVFTAGAYPELGGPDWFPKFDQLLKNVQQSLGETANGLADPAQRG